MQFTAATLLALLASTAAAAPASTGNPANPEEVVINDFTARHTQDGSVQSVGLHITALDATDLACTKSDGVVLGEKYPCGDSKYSFALIDGLFEKWGVRIFHQWGVASGSWGRRDVPAICRAGPLQTTDCTLSTPVWLYITAEPENW